MSIATGQDLGKHLCKIFGLDPKRITRIAIDCRADSVAMLTVERHVEQEQAAAMADEFQRYALGVEVKHFQIEPPR